MALLLLGVGAAQAAESRIPIKLTQTERDFVLTEMRAFLLAVQQVVVGLSGDDMQQVEQSAHKVGMHTARQVPPLLKQKLPQGFKRLGMDTHKRFDQLALDAKQVGDRSLVLEQLSTLMQNCVACHEMFRFELESVK